VGIKGMPRRRPAVILLAGARTLFHRLSVAAIVVALLLVGAPRAVQGAAPSRAADSFAPAPRSTPERVTLQGAGLRGTLTVNLGDSVPLVARGSHLRAGDQIVLRDLFNGKKQKVHTCTEIRCALTVRDNNPESHTYHAVILAPTGTGKMQTVATSNGVTVQWKQLSISLTATDTTHTLIKATDVELAGIYVTLTVQLPDGASSLWKQIQIVDATTGAAKTSCAPTAPCSIQVREFAGTSASALKNATHSYAAVGVGSGVPMRSAPVTITWRPWAVSLSPSGSMNAGSSQAVTLHAQAERTVSDTQGLVFLVTEVGGSPQGAQQCDTSCAVTVGPEKGEHTFVAVVADSTGANLAGASGPAKIHWCAAGSQGGACSQLSATISADKGKVPAGAKVTLTSEAVESLGGSGDHMVITSDNGQTHACPAEADTCSWEVTEKSPVTRTFTVAVAQEDGSSAGPDSDGVEVTWDPWKVVSLTPASQTVPEGTEATLTATANYPLLPGYTLIIYEDNGNESPPCSGGATCTFGAKESIPATHHFHAEIHDASGARVDEGGDASAEVTWTTGWTGTVTIAADTTHPTVGSKARITATVSGPSVTDTGYKIWIGSSTGKTWSCDTSTACYVDETSSTAVSRTYQAWVTDPHGAHVADAPSSVTVTWSARSVGISVVKQSPPLPMKGSDTNPVFPVKTAIKLEGTTTSSLDGTGLQLLVHRVGQQGGTTCSGGTSCIAQLPASGFTGTATYEAVIIDSTGAAVSAPATINISWEPWGIRGYWDNETIGHNFNLNVGISATITATLDFEIAGTGYVLAIWGTSSTEPDVVCKQTTNCKEDYTGDEDGQSVTPTFVVYDPAQTPLDQASAQKVTWGSSGGGGGGGGGGGISIVSFTASDTSPAQGDTVTLTATASATTENTNYKIQIADADTGYIYNQCTADITCTQDVPFTDFGGNTGCSEEGTGSCTYAAYIAEKGSNTPVSNVETVTVTWGAAVRIRTAARAPVASHWRYRAAA
jgi:hypothetical protein